MDTFAASSAHLLELFNRRDTEVEERIATGLTHRQGAGRLRIVDHAGRPLSGATVSGRLVRHDFLFGANAFMVEGFDSAEQNVRFEEAFAELFNSAVVPFFWADLEPEQGRLRFERGSEKIRRRPPPDVVLEFCRRNGLTPKGHCLVWHQMVPEWLPKTPAGALPMIRRRLQEIAARYGREIRYWDVVNEPMERHFFPQATMLGDDYVHEVFAEAGRCFPESARLILNEATTYGWKNFEGPTTGFDLLAQNLQLRGDRLGALGLQYHLFFYEKELSSRVQMLAETRETFLDPRRLFRVLDGHARLGLPLQISEITLPCYAELPDGEQFQADLLRELYRLWFSHPAVESIFWWNLPDGYAHGEEGKLQGGLLNPDLSEKPAYRALRQLIREEWTSAFDGRSEEGRFDFHGFYGTYQVTVKQGGVRKTFEIRLERGRTEDYVVRLDTAPSDRSTASRSAAVAVK